MQRKKRMRKTRCTGGSSRTSSTTTTTTTDVTNRTRKEKRMVRCLESMLIGYTISYDKKKEEEWMRSKYSWWWDHIIHSIKKSLLSSAKLARLTHIYTYAVNLFTDKSFWQLDVIELIHIHLAVVVSFAFHETCSDRWFSLLFLSFQLLLQIASGMLGYAMVSMNSI